MSLSTRYSTYSFSSCRDAARFIESSDALYAVLDFGSLARSEAARLLFAGLELSLELNAPLVLCVFEVVGDSVLQFEEGVVEFF